MLHQFSLFVRRIIPFALLLLTGCGTTLGSSVPPSHPITSSNKPSHNKHSPIPSHSPATLHTTSAPVASSTASSSITPITSSTWPTVSPSTLPSLLQTALANVTTTNQPLVTLSQLIPGTANVAMVPGFSRYRLWFYNSQANAEFPASHVRIATTPPIISPMSASIGYLSVRIFSDSSAARQAFTHTPLFSHFALTHAQPITLNARQTAQLYEASTAPTIIWQHTPWLFAVQNDTSTNVPITQQLAQHLAAAWPAASRHWPYTVNQGRVILAQYPTFGNPVFIIRHSRWIITLSASDAPSLTAAAHLAQSLVQLTTIPVPPSS